ncbi:MAG: hypothetical protein Q8R96_17095 [Bacteroidota bacterium]|nr:hypothetical protein [Bacteroidota bacterium]
MKYPRINIILVTSIFLLTLLGCNKEPNSLQDKPKQEEPTETKRPGAGLLFYGKAEYATDTSAVKNPSITGGFFQIIWSEIEKADGQYDWTAVDSWISPWKKAGKNVALRIMWSTSGYWPYDYYKHPTPQWVWAKGAKYAYHELSHTEIPLIWDPVYKRHAFRFLREASRKFGKDKTILFLDITPGAETNPYRFGTIDEKDPAFRDKYLKTTSSDGKVFSEQIWFATIREFIDSSKVSIKEIPLLVTLNTGNMPNGTSQMVANGDYCAGKGLYVGQNGLRGTTPVNNFEIWSHTTKVFYEMYAKSGGSVGTLMEVMQAAQLNNTSYLNVYPEDVRKGTKGNPEYDKIFEDALKFGAEVALKNK